MSIPPIEAAWLAGFLEGEGTFQISRSRQGGYESFAPAIAATSVDHAVLLRCRDIAGGYVYGPVGRGNGRWKPAYRWTVKSRALDPILAGVVPHLIAKREQALVLRALRDETTPGAPPGHFGRKSDDGRLERRRDMKLAVNALNHRGATRPPPEQLAALDRVRALLS